MKDKLKGGAVVVYRRKLILLRDLVKREGLKMEVVSVWWKRNGFPNEIKPEEIAHLRPRIKKAPKLYTLEPDGTKHRANELCSMFGLPPAAISNLTYRTGRTVVTREELKRLSGTANGLKSANNPGADMPPRPKSIHDVEYNPTAMERSIMGVR